MDVRAAARNAVRRHCQPQGDSFLLPLSSCATKYPTFYPSALRFITIPSISSSVSSAVHLTLPSIRTALRISYLQGVKHFYAVVGTGGEGGEPHALGEGESSSTEAGDKVAALLPRLERLLDLLGSMTFHQAVGMPTIEDWLW